MIKTYINRYSKQTITVKPVLRGQLWEMENVVF
jgi:hypothetical protein